LIRKFQARVELVPSGGGAFEIAVDGRLVYSKKALGRFPTDEEIDRLDRRPAL
jgi:selenoprotein W-related protein